jgi:hypothetical protein
LAKTSPSFIDGFRAARRLVVVALLIVSPLTEVLGLLLLDPLFATVQFGDLVADDFDVDAWGSAPLGERSGSSTVGSILNALGLPTEMAFSRLLEGGGEFGGEDGDGDAGDCGFPISCASAEPFVSMTSEFALGGIIHNCLFQRFDCGITYETFVALVGEMVPGLDHVKPLVCCTEYFAQHYNTATSCHVPFQ